MLCQPLSLSYFGCPHAPFKSSIGSHSVIVSPKFDGRGGRPPLYNFLCFASTKLVLWLGLDSSCFLEHSKEVKMNDMREMAQMK
jgi:hypothetical protein